MDPVSPQNSPLPSQASPTRRQKADLLSLQGQSSGVPPTKPPSDSVSLSSGILPTHENIEALSTLPEIRQDRVNRIQQAMAEGTYSVSSSDLAEALIHTLELETPQSPPEDNS